ncbi:tail fiber domain-containing protein [Shewanella sp. SG41-4]|uniref:tail fiber domain-containing protein n=1 Tax=Shewanella sp. SG41-4 TaxID=2760976 RepID=UPI001600505A|nr:tail fiber domain-containing protein [Shewanella sp. SG41-4]MBB1439400.1 tail fiber domain-containing protein [Shewanella sp. SG41-4]
MKTTRKLALAIIPLVVSANLYADQVINDDLIITSSACMGFDCVNGESFGFDTLRLKENNVRIKFDDTSSTGSFPSNDWQLTANDSSNGGQNKFSIDDTTSGRTPFTIEAKAPSHSLYVDDGGRIGLGTNNPVVEIHISNGDSPTIRLEQNGSSGFTPQTWDVAGNETNFFIRDATNGSTLPFRIRPGAPSNSLYIDTDGDIGLGTASPDAQLHVIDSTSTNLSTSSVLVENTNAARNSVLLELAHAGNSYLKMSNTEASPTVAYWLLGSRQDGTFSFTNNVGGQVFIVDSTGNITTKGTVTANNVLLTSDVNKKENFQTINGTEILGAISKLAISKWNYKSQSVSEQHIGPMAQDFYKLFGLGGNDDKHISAIDSAGISLAAIQALYDLNMKKDQQIEELSKRISDLEMKTK